MPNKQRYKTRTLTLTHTLCIWGMLRCGVMRQIHEANSYHKHNFLCFDDFGYNSGKSIWNRLYLKWWICMAAPADIFYNCTPFHFISIRFVTFRFLIRCIVCRSLQINYPQWLITLVNPLKWISCQIERKSKLYTSIQRMVERVFFWVGTKIKIAKSGRCQSRNWAGLHIFSLWRCRSMIFCAA